MGGDIADGPRDLAERLSMIRDTVDEERVFEKKGERTERTQSCTRLVVWFVPSNWHHVPILGTRQPLCYIQIATHCASTASTA
jgi:hypothetical protein